MKRYLDPLFFAVVFGIDVAVWISASFIGSVPPTVIVMAPAFFSLALFALARVYLNFEPKRFYMFVAGAAGVFALSMWVTDVLTPPLEQFDFLTGTWVLVVCGLGALLGLFLAVAGAIPSPEKAKLEKAAAHAKQVEQKKQRKAEQEAQKVQAKAARSNRGTDGQNVEVQVTEVVTEDK